MCVGMAVTVFIVHQKPVRWSWEGVGGGGVNEPPPSRPRPSRQARTWQHKERAPACQNVDSTA